MNELASGEQVRAEEPSAQVQFSVWLTSLCAAIPDTLGGVVVLGPPDAGPFAPLAFWPAGETGAPRLADTAEQALGERQLVAAFLEDGTHALALPIAVEGHVHGVVAVELVPRSEAELQVALQQLRLGVDGLAAWIQGRQQHVALGTEDRLMTVLDLLAGILEEARFEPACRSLATELATRLQCDRVSVGTVRGGHAAVTALSHSALIGKRMNLIHAVGAAMDEAIDQKAVIRFPPAPGDDIVVLRDHTRLATEHGSGSILTVPMSGADRFSGALLLERPASMPFERTDLDLVQSLTAAAARVLELKQLNERSLFKRTGDAIVEQVRRLTGPRYVKRKLAVGLILFGAVFFTFATGAYRVTAPATLEGAVRRTISAPFDGYVASAPVRAGDLARSGTVLATLDEREMRLERLKWASQYAQYLKQHQEAVANRDRAKSQIVQALYEQAQAQVALLDEQLARAAVKAPFDGVVVKGDLSQSLGSAVKRGDVLFEITPLESYRVIVNVDEREIAAVSSGQQGTLILSSIAQESFRFTVGSVTSVTTAREGKNYFRVEATLERSTDRLRPGMEGVAKIEIDERRLIWIWTHRMVNWLRLFIWTYLP